MSNSITKQTQVLNYHIPFYRKYLNRLGFVERQYIYFISLIMIATSPMIYQGLKRSKRIDEKDMWFRNEVRDPKNPYFGYIDDKEAPPQPLGKRN